MNENFDPKWPHGHVTRDGRKARIVATELRTTNETIVAVVNEGDEDSVRLYYPDGRYWFAEPSDHDLLNAPKPATKYVTYTVVHVNDKGVTWSNATSMPIQEEDKFIESELKSMTAVYYDQCTCKLFRQEWEVEAPE